MTRLLLQFKVALASALLCTVAWSSGDPTAGKSSFETCAGCHAIPGYMSTYPNYHVPRLGGQNAEYIITALKSYQDHNRWHPTMQANVASLSESDMRNIASYLSSYTANTASAEHRARGNVEAGRQKSTSCVACHGQSGNSTTEIYPKLAGQYEDYLYQALKDYQDSKRKNPVMEGMTANLSAQDIADLAAYFSSQPIGLTVVEPQ